MDEQQLENQQLENQPPNPPETEEADNSNNLPMVLDIVSGVGLAAGAILPLIGQGAMAGFPFAIAVGLNMVNRKQLATQMAQSQQLAVTQLSEQLSHTQTTLSEQVSQFQHNINAQLQQQRQEQQTKLNGVNESLTGNIDELQTSLTNLTQSHQTLQNDHQSLNEFTQNLDGQCRKLEDVVGELRQIDNFTQSLRGNPNEADAYYRRGVSHQNLGDYQEAVDDYTEALRLESTHAQAYHHRGIVYAALGNKKRAAEDLRLAAKFYFEQGNLDSYQQARELSQDYYDSLTVVLRNDAAQKIAVATPAPDDEDAAALPVPETITLQGLFN